MKNEFELVSHSRFQYLNIFMVHLLSRTPHIHRDLEIGVILDGFVTVRIGGRSWELHENDIYLINSMEAHEFSTEGTGTLVLAFQISPKLLSPFLPDAEMRRFLSEPPLQAVFSKAPEVYAELLSLCGELACQYYTQPDNYEIYCIRHIISILYLLAQHIPVEILSRQDFLPIKRRAERMAEITDYIDQNFQRKLLLEELAEKYGLTLTYLSHLFKDSLGISFQQYLKEKRFEYAYQQITATDRSLLDISMESGFSDTRYLIKMFDQKIGCSPKEYRKKRQAATYMFNIATESSQHFLPDDIALSVINAWQSE